MGSVACQARPPERMRLPFGETISNWVVYLTERFPICVYPIATKQCYQRHKVIANVVSSIPKDRVVIIYSSVAVVNGGTARKELRFPITTDYNMSYHATTKRI